MECEWKGKEPRKELMTETGKEYMKESRKKMGRNSEVWCEIYGRNWEYMKELGKEWEGTEERS